MNLWETLKMKKKTKEETPEEICERWLKKAILDENTIGTKRFRAVLYNNLIKYGIHSIYDFCKADKALEIMYTAEYKKYEDQNRIFEIRKEVTEIYFKK